MRCMNVGLFSVDTVEDSLTRYTHKRYVHNYKFNYKNVFLKHQMFILSFIDKILENSITWCGHERYTVIMEYEMGNSQ